MLTLPASSFDNINSASVVSSLRQLPPSVIEVPNTLIPFIGIDTLIDSLQNNGDSPPQCHLLGDFGWGVQGLLGALCFSILLVKRFREKQRRTGLIFLFDSIKQGCGSFTLHILNMIASYLQSKNSSRSSSNHQDPCTWYMINIVLDTTLGVFVTFLLLKSFRSFTLGTSNRHLEFGYYGDPPSLKTCIIQLGLWQIIVATMKIIMVFLMFIFSHPLYSTASFLLYPFDFHPQIKLVVVMVFTPFVMNAFQYWVTDNILMKRPSASRTPSPAQRRPKPMQMTTVVDSARCSPRGRGAQHVPLATNDNGIRRSSLEDIERRHSATATEMITLASQPTSFSTTGFSRVVDGGSSSSSIRNGSISGRESYDDA